MSESVTIYPRGVRTEVPVDVCRCPILTVGDACPVHQHIGTSSWPPKQEAPSQLYLTKTECLVMLQALAFAVDPSIYRLNEAPTDATECSRVVWSARDSTSVQRSLATALAEATY